MNRIALVGASAAALLALAACSTPVSKQTPVASSGPASPTSSKLTAPQVPNPLNASRFEQDPCSVISQTQASQVANLTTSRKTDGNVAPICIWSDSDHNRVTFGFIPGNGGLTTSYKFQDSDSGYFAVAPDVAGYPAVYAASHDDRNDGGCFVAVGISNDEVMTTSVSFRQPSPYHSDPCALVVKAAAVAVSNLKGGA